MRTFSLVLALLVAVPACSSGDGDAACAPVRREALDPSSSAHVLPGAPAPDYATDPPTSGAHTSGRPAAGVLRAPLTRPEQVAVLETGRVLVQYDPGAVDGDDRRAVEDLAGADITVAPNPDLPTAVVATAWTVKQTCSRVDLEALRRFAHTHRSTDLHQ